MIFFVQCYESLYATISSPGELKEGWWFYSIALGFFKWPCWCGDLLGRYCKQKLHACIRRCIIVIFLLYLEIMNLKFDFALNLCSYTPHLQVLVNSYTVVVRISLKLWLYCEEFLPFVTYVLQYTSFPFYLVQIISWLLCSHCVATYIHVQYPLFSLASFIVFCF